MSAAAFASSWGFPASFARTASTPSPSVSWRWSSSERKSLEPVSYTHLDVYKRQVKDPVECKALYEMDGVAHVRKGVSYPAVMGVGGWNDPRVAPWEPGKFVAALQNASVSGKPVLMKINYDDGHFTEEKTVTFRNFAGQDAFLLWQAGDKEFQPVD